MLLQDWLTRESLTYGQFAGAIRRSPEAVRRYATGDRIPDREAMAAIVRETSGRVTPNDFYGLANHSISIAAAQHVPSPGISSPESPSVEQAA